MAEKNQESVEQQQVVVSQDSKASIDYLMSSAGQEAELFAVVQRKAKMYATSSIVPTTYQGMGNIGNVVIALDMAQRMNANPLMVMQNLYNVHGNPAWSSKFLIATINACGKFTPLRYQFRGKEGQDDWACRAVAYEKHDTDHKDPLEGDWISIGMAKQEGWYNKAGSKWKTMPGQMLRYRAASFWQRVYAPEISMGLSSADEVEDTYVDYEDVSQQEQEQDLNIETPEQKESTPKRKF